jgi:hypothetical protein
MDLTEQHLAATQMHTKDKTQVIQTAVELFVTHVAHCLKHTVVILTGLVNTLNYSS